MRVLVCGGRDYENADRVSEVLSRIFAERGGVHLIHGDARGADRCAATWGEQNLMPGRVHSYPANWKAFGRSAGPIRNRQMVEEGKPDLVVAFPGGKGTANMVKLAREANVEVIEICE